MRPKVALINCGSFGIGKEFAIQLKHSGWKVFATAHTLKPLAELGYKTAQLDVTNQEQINDVVQNILKEESTIDLSQ